MSAASRVAMQDALALGTQAGVLTMLRRGRDQNAQRTAMPEPCYVTDSVQPPGPLRGIPRPRLTMDIVPVGSLGSARR